jgi:hypothetical protein
MLLAFALFLCPVASDAFCGFYVAKADTKLWNKASKVVIVRDGDRTVLTMANDYRGEPAEFAMVVPVPVVLEEGQVHVASPSLIEHLDAYTAPRLVEYFDEDPCHLGRMELDAALPSSAGAARKASAMRDQALGVTIEASYTVGEYDILILSAQQSDGLAAWLRENEYRIPAGAEPILASYLKQGMRFFVAKVNLEEKDRLGTANLRPLQMAFETPRFGLPIRLGTVNGDGQQELFVYTLTRTGRVETTNYRTVRIPTGDDLPPYVESRFADFYRDMFGQQARQESGTGVFLEYAWDMAWCDPCAANPLSPAELRELGVFWTGGPQPQPAQGRVAPQAADVFVSRLHIRYDAESFPEDLRFQTTGDRSNFQGRYVLRHPWQGTSSCPAADEYRRRLPERQENEARNLARLTGWDVEEIRSEMGLLGQQSAPEPWWQQIWR